MGQGVAIISGASAGIGLATAERFLADGLKVANLSRRPCPLEDVKHITCDLGDHSFTHQVGSALIAFTQRAERIVLVHNASRLDNDTAQNTSADALRTVLDINVVATSILNQTLLPMMQPGSSILYVGSTLSEKAVPGSFSYVTSKHAQIGMMRGLCQDLAGSGIHTACICPGFTDTEMLRTHVPDDAMDSVRSMSAFGRLIEPQEIAETIAWCAAQPVINGAVIHANLGQVES